MSIDLDLYQDIVLEHKRAPRNFGPLPGATHGPRAPIRSAATK